MNRVWHRLDPWPDVVEGLKRLKSKFIIAPCSNGNIALMVNMAKRAGLPWDCILGAETARAYKPMPEAYLASCRQLGLAPAAVLMVAAHNSDLKAAKAQGLATAFVARPDGARPGSDHRPRARSQRASMWRRLTSSSSRPSWRNPPDIGYSGQTD